MKPRIVLMEIIIIIIISPAQYLSSAWLDSS